MMNFSIGSVDCSAHIRRLLKYLNFSSNSDVWKWRTHYLSENFGGVNITHTLSIREFWRLWTSRKNGFCTFSFKKGRRRNGSGHCSSSRSERHVRGLASLLQEQKNIFSVHGNLANFRVWNPRIDRPRWAVEGALCVFSIFRRSDWERTLQSNFVVPSERPAF